jgi:hypothetical protein
LATAIPLENPSAASTAEKLCFENNVGFQKGSGAHQPEQTQQSSAREFVKLKYIFFGTRWRPSCIFVDIVTVDHIIKYSSIVVYKMMKRLLDDGEMAFF